MDHTAQTGGFEMAVQWSDQTNSYHYRCAWGCEGYDFDSYDDASRAFERHICWSSR